jgi:hypothetical protein
MNQVACIQFRAHSFLLFNTEEKLLSISLYNAIREGKGFVPLVIVTSTKK